jgi:hypothetical protein
MCTWLIKYITYLKAGTAATTHSICNKYCNK